MCWPMVGAVRTVSPVGASGRTSELWAIAAGDPASMKSVTKKAKRLVRLADLSIVFPQFSFTREANPPFSLRAGAESPRAPNPEFGPRDDRSRLRVGGKRAFPGARSRQERYSTPVAVAL